MNRIKEAREAAGLSQQFVALTLGVKPPSVCNWENGKSEPTPANLRALAQLLDVSTDYLLGNDSTQRNDPRSEAKRLLEGLSDEQYKAVLQYIKFVEAQK